MLRLNITLNQDFSVSFIRLQSAPRRTNLHAAQLKLT